MTPDFWGECKRQYDNILSIKFCERVFLSVRTKYLGDSFMPVISELRGLKQLDHNLECLGYILREFQASLVGIMRLLQTRKKIPRVVGIVKADILQLFLTELLEEVH